MFFPLVGMVPMELLLSNLKMVRSLKMSREIAITVIISELVLLKRKEELLELSLTSCLTVCMSDHFR